MAASIKKEYSSFTAFHEEIERLLSLSFEAKMLYIFTAPILCHTDEDWSLFMQTILPKLDGWATCDAFLSDIGKNLKKDIVRTAFESCFSFHERLPLYGIRVFITTKMYYHKYRLESVEKILADVERTKPFWSYLTIRQAVAWTLATISIEEFETILDKWYLPIRNNENRSDE
ncbi:MAG: hypothetical protein Q3998_07140, partial [Porphyromonas sp.]|nr:hypothetical protein [Porphyromonas sp.]